MRQGTWRHSPALVVAVIALFVALGGSVYAAKRARIDGKAIRAKSIPGNRLKPRSITADRLRPGVLSGQRSQRATDRRRHQRADPGPGAERNPRRLGRHRAERGRRADGAQRRQRRRCEDRQRSQRRLPARHPPLRRHLLGQLVEAAPSTLRPRRANAPPAAARCPRRCSSPPSPKRPNVNLDPGDEWSSDIPVVSGSNAYATVTVSATSAIDKDISNHTHAYRCVFPLLS